MNTRLISYVTLVAFAITSIPGRADVSDEFNQELVAADQQLLSSTPTLAETNTSEEADEDYSAPQGTEVQQADDSQKKSEKRQMWINIGLAVTAVIVAVVALVIVSNNNGHHHSK